MIGTILEAHFYDPPPAALSIFGSTHFLSLFVTISGYNATLRYSQWNARRQLRIFQLIFLYFWCQLLYIVFVYFVLVPVAQRHYHDKEKADDFLKSANQFYILEGLSFQAFKMEEFWIMWFGTPAYILWYLQALFSWILLIPLWMNLKYPLFASIVLSYSVLICTNSIFTPLSTSNAIKLWPFFVFGASIKFYEIDKRFYHFSKSGLFVYASWIMVFLSLAFSLWCPFTSGEFILYAAIANIDPLYVRSNDNSSYHLLGWTAFLVYSFAIQTALFSIVPTFETYFSRAGKFSLVAFILHYMALLVLGAIGYDVHQKSMQTGINY
mmetsp:Transcript_31657/g.51426  ORF Transcript_31657/g.51426 Transcript_31657/m.51426 type:complete len:324 (+) Transcript_31657:845-1816(+)